MASKPFFNKEFNTTIYWDVDMLSGYDYEFLTNFTFNKNKAIIKRINFGIFTKFLLNKYDAVIITVTFKFPIPPKLNAVKIPV